MAGTCSTVIAVTIAASTTCQISLDNPEIVKVPRSRDTVSFIKYFQYSIGPDPDGTQPNYGFSLDITGQGAFAVNTRWHFTPSTPNISGDAALVKHGRVEIEAELDRSLAESLAAGAAFIDTYYRIQMDTGTV